MTMLKDFRRFVDRSDRNRCRDRGIGGRGCRWRNRRHQRFQDSGGDRRREFDRPGCDHLLLSKAIWYGTNSGIWRQNIILCAKSEVSYLTRATISSAPIVMAAAPDPMSWLNVVSIVPLGPADSTNTALFWPNAIPGPLT